MKPEELAKTLPYDAGMLVTRVQRQKDAETITGRLPSVDDLDEVVVWPLLNDSLLWKEEDIEAHLQRLDHELCQRIHDYYESKLRGEQPFCRVCGGTGQTLVMPKRVLGATYVDGDIQDETLVPCPYCQKGEV